MPKYKATFIEQRLNTWEMYCIVEAKDLKEAKQLLTENPHDYMNYEFSVEEQVLPRTTNMQHIRKIQGS